MKTFELSGDPRAISKVILSCPFLQTRLMTTYEFSKYGSDRDVSISWQLIHELALRGILSPIAIVDPRVAQMVPDRFVSFEVDEQKYFADLWPEIYNQKPSFDGRHDHKGDTARSMLWHPIQLWSLDQILRRLSLNMAVETTVDGLDYYLGFIERLWKRQSPVESLWEFANDPAHRQLHSLIALWVYAEARFIAETTGRISLNLAPDRQHLSDYMEWYKTFSFVDLADELSINAEVLGQWHRRFGVSATLADPVDKWRILLRYVPRSHRVKFTKSALFAEDNYYFAEVIRRFSEMYFGTTDLPEEDDMMHVEQGPVVKERFYGSRKSITLDRSVKRQVVRQYDLDPQPRYRWMLEGQSEIGFVERFAELVGISLGQWGISLINLRGIGGVGSEYARAHLHMSSSEEVFTYISVDHDGQQEHIRILGNYASQGILSIGYQIFEPDFESANFTADILAAAASANTGVTDDPNLMFRVDEILEIRKELNISVGNAIARLANRKQLRFAKGELWGRCLADAVVDNVELSVDSGSPIVAAFYTALRAGDSNYRSTNERMMVDQVGKLVERPDNG